MNKQYLEVLCESAANSDSNLNPVIEGKTWDKVKKVWRDHKGKIIAGATAAGVVAAGGVGVNRIADGIKKEKTKRAEQRADVKKMVDQTNKNLNAIKDWEEAEAEAKAKRRSMA